jgi:hypothetical protein
MILLWAMACRASIKVGILESARKVAEEYYLLKIPTWKDRGSHN